MLQECTLANGVVQATPNPSVTRTRLIPPFTQGRLMLHPRVAAQPYLRRDPCSEITWLGIPAWVSKGTKSLRGILKGKALKRCPEAEPLAPSSM